MTIQDIMNSLRDMKAEYLNDNITIDELMDCMDDLIRDTEGKDAYSGFGTAMEDDGFYETPDFTQLVVN